METVDVELYKHTFSTPPKQKLDHMIKFFTSRVIIFYLNIKTILAAVTNIPFSLPFLCLFPLQPLFYGLRQTLFLNIPDGHFSLTILINKASSPGFRYGKDMLLS